MTMYEMQMTMCKKFLTMNEKKVTMCEKIDEGSALLLTAQQLNLKQGKEYGEQNSATNVLNVSRKNFGKVTYIPHLKLARKLFVKDPGIRAALCLDGERKHAFSTWELDVRQFYTHALSNPDVLNGFAAINVTVPVLQDGLSQLDGLTQLYAVQKKETAEAQQATDERDQAFDNIVAWMGIYYTVAKIALDNKPQLLEKLGIKA
jgi:hypothetical protein